MATPWDGEVRVVMRGVADSEHRTYASGDDQNLAVDSGTIDARGIRDPSSGRLVRWKTGGGSSLVWTFQVTVYHQGSTARFEITAPPANAPHLRYAIGITTRWDSRQAGTAFPDAGRALIEPALTSGQTFVVQVAYLVPDNEQAGFRRLDLKYLASLNGAALPVRSPAQSLKPRASAPPWAEPLPAVPRGSVGPRRP